MESEKEACRIGGWQGNEGFMYGLKPAAPYGLIYFIHADEVKRTKVGWTTQAIEKRLEGLQTGSPCALHLDGVIAAKPETESLLHRTLRKHRHIGEWFNDHELLDSLRMRVSVTPQEASADFVEYAALVSRHQILGILESIIPAPWVGIWECMSKRWDSFVRECLPNHVGELASGHHEELRTQEAFRVVHDALRALFPRCICCHHKT